nr:MAG TPA: hypothetical protein [Caudoviricetes sp.]
MIVLQRVTGYERKEPSKRWPSKHRRRRALGNRKTRVFLHLLRLYARQNFKHRAYV